LPIDKYVGGVKGFRIGFNNSIGIEIGEKIEIS